MAGSRSLLSKWMADFLSPEMLNRLYIVLFSVLCICNLYGATDPAKFHSSTLNCEYFREFKKNVDAKWKISGQEYDYSEEKKSNSRDIGPLMCLYYL